MVLHLPSLSPTVGTQAQHLKAARVSCKRATRSSFLCVRGCLWPLARGFARRNPCLVHPVGDFKLHMANLTAAPRPGCHHGEKPTGSRHIRDMQQLCRATKTAQITAKVALQPSITSLSLEELKVQVKRKRHPYMLSHLTQGRC